MALLHPGMQGCLAKHKILRKTQFFSIFPLFGGVQGKDEPEPAMPSPSERTDPAFINLISALGLLIFAFPGGFPVPGASPGATDGDDDDDDTGGIKSWRC